MLAMHNTIQLSILSQCKNNFRSQKKTLIAIIACAMIYILSLGITSVTFAQNSTLQQLDSYSKRLATRMISSLTLRLGDGFSTNNHLSIGETALNLKDTKITYSGMQSTIFLTQTIEKSELAKIFNIDLTANGGWGLFSASASAAYLRHIEDNQFTENFAFMERYYVHSLLDISSIPANLDSLTDNARDLYTHQGIKNFTIRYGDSFIVDLPIGAVLVANIQLNFVTALDKQKFDATINGKFGSIFSAGANLQAAINKAKVKGTVEVSAFQIGGTPENLPNVFTKKPNADYYITTCSLENLKDCRDAINGIIEYAQVDFRKQIAAQKIGAKPEGNLVPVGEPYLMTYSSKFNLLPAPKLDSSVLKHRLALAELFNELRHHKTFFDHYLTSPVAAYFTVAADKLLHSIQADLEWNLSLVNQFGPLCYVSGEEEKCNEVIANLKENFKPIDPNVIEFYLSHGFNQVYPNCNYIPVGTPDDENPPYANFCLGQWIKGIFSLKLNAEKNILSIRGDYVTPNGQHVQSEGYLAPFNANVIYSGSMIYHNLSTGWKHKGTISIRMTKNNV